MLSTSSNVTAESTTVKGMIRIHGTDVWTIDPTLFPVLGLPQQQMKFLLRYATLAPSAFNSQPWLFLVKDDEVSLYINRRHCMVAADPHDRGIYLSCGAVLQYLWLAARHYGYKGLLLLPTFAPSPHFFRLLTHIE